MQKKQTENPLNRGSIVIEGFDGELSVLLDPREAIKFLDIEWPLNPPRASKVTIHSNQNIKNISNKNAFFDVSFTSMNANSNISFVRCPVDNIYLCTGQNDFPPMTKKPFFGFLSKLFKGRKT